MVDVAHAGVATCWKEHRRRRRLADEQDDTWNGGVEEGPQDRAVRGISCAAGARHLAFCECRWPVILEGVCVCSGGCLMGYGPDRQGHGSVRAQKQTSTFK